MSGRISPAMARRALATLCAVLDVPYTDTYEHAGWVLTSVGLGRYAVAEYDGIGTSEGRPIEHHIYSPAEVYERCYFAAHAIEAAATLRDRATETPAQLPEREAMMRRVIERLTEFDARERESARAARKWRRQEAARNAHAAAVFHAEALIRQAQQ